MPTQAPPHPGGPPASAAPSAPNVPFLLTREPTGKPPWPMVVLAGVDKSGKSIAAAEFTGSDLIGQTFWIEIGEGYADHYGSLPNARYRIAPHDGTYRGIAYAAWAATRQPRIDGKPNLIVVDTVTALWDMLSNEAQMIANRRRKDPDSEATITNDLWNMAKKRWGHFIDVLRAHDGPVVLVTRLEYVSVVNSKGEPTKAKEWKVKAEKTLPFEADVIVRMPTYRTYEVTGVRSLRLQIPPGEVLKVPDFTLELLMKQMGLDEQGATLPRVYVPPKPDPAEALAMLAPPTARQAGDATGRFAQNILGDERSMPQAPGPSQEQLKQLAALFAEVGPASDDGRAELVENLLGRTVESMADLTGEQAQRIIDHFEQLKRRLREADTGADNTDGSGGDPVWNPALEAVELEEPEAMRGAEDFAGQLRTVVDGAAVDRVEARIREAYAGRVVNAPLFVELLCAARDRRAELGIAVEGDPVWTALTEILLRARARTRSSRDVGQIYQLIRHHQRLGHLADGQAEQLMHECHQLYTQVVTRRPTPA